MKIIPAMDILNGKLVRLEKGIFQSRKIYSENPFETAKLFAANGFETIHIVDLSGSKDGKIKTLKLLQKIKTELKLQIQFGGGIRSLDDAIMLIKNGVDKIIAGSISVADKNEFEKIICRISSDKIIAAVDSEDEQVKIKGWTENSGINIYNHIDCCLANGIDTFLCTDIKKDGMLTGPNVELYQKLKTKYPKAKIIASGGVSRIEDVKNLKMENLYGVVVGKAIYENKIKLKELSGLAG